MQKKAKMAKFGLASISHHQSKELDLPKLAPTVDLFDE